MLRRLLNGMIFGAGFGIAFISIWFLAFYWFVPLFYNHSYSSSDIKNNDKEISSVPPVNSGKQFLGSTGYYSGNFLENKTGVLTSGPGTINGKVSVNNQPLEGLKIRLALNSSVLSQWAISDTKGDYKISVPYGKYIIDGYELDHEIVHSVLSGKIAHPGNPLRSNEFSVSENSYGSGLALAFVDPVIKTLAKTKYSSSEDILLEWLPYPGASKYSIQVYEKTNPAKWSNETLFKWLDKPVVSETAINLKTTGAHLKTNHYYVLMIYALDNEDNILSQTTDIHDGYDFEVVE